MRLSDLQNKDVVDMLTGERIGNVIDIEIDDKGLITKIIIYDKKKLFSLKGSEEISLKWEQIKKIGSDVILVNKN